MNNKNSKNMKYIYRIYGFIENITYLLLLLFRLKYLF